MIFVTSASARAQDAARPRFIAAIGMGTSFDRTGFMGNTETVPAFFATGGVGADWPVGVELAAFATEASGRFAGPATPIDRLALAAIGVVRPAAWPIAADDRAYGARLLRGMAAELGLALERDGTTVRAGSRYGLHLGARIDFPLGPAGGASELRLRLAVRHMEGLYTPRITINDADVAVGNSTELYAAIVTIF
ncbi:MAG TPA: hypothetical protein VK989_00260 [Polyangia bacterium]|nr:hypothetical protein [Polyangia bacterium]